MSEYSGVFDIMARLCAIVLCIRSLCVMNRMSWKKWSLFSFPVVIMGITSGYIVFVGAVDKEITYPILIAMVTAMCLLDKRRTMVRKDRHESGKT